jgi:RNA polymerase sigma-70 factor (ECF subfamily)
MSHRDRPGSGLAGPGREERKRLSEEEKHVLYRALFDDYYRPTFYFFARRGFDIETVRDLTQETFLRVYRGLDGYRSDADYRTWIRAIARNLYLNHWRGFHADKRQRVELSLDEAFEGRGVPERTEGSWDLDPEEEALQGERRERLRRALERLPPQARRCQQLRLEGLKYREIATVLGISLQAVRSHLAQGRQRLEEILGEAALSSRDPRGADPSR